MNDLSIFPADIAEMSVSQLANLPAQQLVEVDTNLDQAIAWLKAARTKLDAAFDQRFGVQGREALHASGRDFGFAHIKADGLHVKFELPKKVSWDQNKLKAMAERLVASGDVVEEYIDIKLSVSETKYTSWPVAFRQQFADARTAKEGKPVIHISPDSEV